MIKAKEKIIWHQEAGMTTLALVLMLVMVGGLVLPPLLNLMITASKVGQVEERKTKEFYSADAGIAAALWRIKTNYKLDWLNSLSGRWDETVYGHSPAYENYTLPLAPNGNKVVYTLAPKWVLEGLETQNGTQQRTPAENVKVYGSYNGTGSNGRGSYKILIYYDGLAPEGALGISRIGCWLPAGLEYVDGSSYLENTYTPARPYSDPQVTDFRGGHTIIWTFSPAVDFNLFYPAGTQKEITFEFTPNENRQGGFCWLRSNTSSNYLAWSALNIFEVKSTATSPTGETTRATSYSVRNVGDTFGSAMEGDYYAFGNTLMRDNSSADQTSRDRLYKETKYTVSAIPANAQVEYIFLYWTGWKCKPWNGMTDTTVAALPVTKQVNKVLVTCNTTVGGVKFSENITASLTQAMINKSGSSQHGWSYSCFADITDRVKAFFTSQGVPYVGNGTYTVTDRDFTSGSTAPSTGGPWYGLYNFNSLDNTAPYSGESVIGYTRYPLGSPRDGDQTNTERLATSHPTQSAINEGTGSEDSWAYSAWSIVIVYTSPATLGHQLYRYDTFAYGDEYKGYPYPNPPKTISGFVVPDLTDETNAAKITCFVAEGDYAYAGDSIIVNGSTLPQIATGYPSDNVWNSKSLIPGTPETAITGIDIDTWNISTSIIGPEGTSSATVYLPTGQDSWSLVYMILSFRSKITSGGSFIYDIQ